MSAAGRPLSLFVVAGEESGDQLGAALMAAISAMTGGTARFEGVGGTRMEAAGLAPLFPMADIALNGIGAILSHLPSVIARIGQTAAAIVAHRPDALVIVDSPDFTHRVARRVRRAAPDVPILDYVSPTVWAWRPGRAAEMRAYVDQVLAILPFEPDVHRRLGGPPCTYVGHPLVERLDRLRPAPGERAALGAGRPVFLVLPGSRGGEIERHMPLFGDTVARIAAARPDVEPVLPAVPHLAARIGEHVARWPVRPSIVVGEDAKFAAFRRAHAALAASGTVTLELALAGVPMAVAYRLEPLIRLARPILFRKALRSAPVESIVLANLVLGDRTVPELVDREGTPESLAAAVLPLLADGPERRAQTTGFERLDAVMRLDRGTPSGRAAELVIAAAEAGRR